ncbi:MAG TPA: flagellar basal-body MS-ring/collar protein FliF, partial [Chloroflexota bacterium]|nr:flagellar basal-body MS-ring/collar protein FliF [Chloroflexota bacterium]
EDEATVVAKLKDAKIPYELGAGGVVKVAGSQVNEAKLALAGAGLAGKPASGSGFELFDQTGLSFGQTEFTQAVNYQRALENELARSIGRMDAVEWARVHLVIPRPTLFTSQQKEPTASVILKLKPGKRFDRAQVRSISNLLTGSVEGLKPQNVSIVDNNGNTLSQDPAADGGAGLTSRQLQIQHDTESGAEQNLQALLDRVLGPGKAAVRVSALMDWDQIEQTAETYTPGDPAQTPVRSSKELTETTTGGAQAGGVPGLVSNAGNGTVPTYQAGGGNGSTSQKTDRETNYELNKSIQKVVRAPGQIKRLSVSVMLDDDPNNPDAQLQRSVQDAITAAAGIDLNRGDQLVVTPLAFNRQELQTTEAAMADAAKREETLAYAHIAALALGPVLLLLVLWLVLRGGRKVTVERKTANAAHNGALLVPGVERLTIEAMTDPSAARRPAMPRPVAQPIAEDPQKVYIHEQIQGLARNNPAMVAQLIQTWIDEDRRN